MLDLAAAFSCITMSRSRLATLCGSGSEGIKFYTFRTSATASTTLMEPPTHLCDHRPAQETQAPTSRAPAPMPTLQQAQRRHCQCATQRNQTHRPASGRGGGRREQRVEQRVFDSRGREAACFGFSMVTLVARYALEVHLRVRLNISWFRGGHLVAATSTSQDCGADALCIQRRAEYRGNGSEANDRNHRR